MNYSLGCNNHITFLSFLECVATCPSIASTAVPLVDGEAYETDNTGCCASLKKVCKKETCPPETECSENLVKVLDLSTKDLCCPKYKCGKKIMSGVLFLVDCLS